MLGNKKIRNPFPRIGLVCKYEFLSGTRTFVPVYLATMVLCLITGIFLTERISAVSNTTFLAILGTACGLMSFAAFILTIVFIEKRFKKGMLENEAYLNLSLPVTITEHILGRLLAYFTWGCIYIATSIISGLLLACSQWNRIFNISLFENAATQFYKDSGMHILSLLLLIALFVLTLILLAVMFIFFVNTTASLVKKCRMLVEIAIIIILFIIFGNILHAAFENLYGIGDISAFIIGLKRFILINLGTVILDILGTIAILKFRMNLEA